jgi:hypothetical protein
MGCIYSKPICIPNNSPKVYSPQPLKYINNDDISYNKNPVMIKIIN